MKKYINYLVSAFLCGTLFASCADDDYTVLDKGHNELAMTASATGIELDEQNHADDALELSWTTGTNYGTGNRISYTLELAEAGTGFANARKVVDGVEQTYSVKWSVEELNNLLRTRFGVTGEKTLSLEARLTAAVSGSEEVQTAIAAFTVSTYVPVTSTLYLIGSATPNGWSADDATEMKRSDNGVFTWTGNMTAGEYKFITTRGSFFPAYVDNGNGAPILRTGDDDPTPDVNFTIEEAHCYQIAVNLLTGTVAATQVEGILPRFDQLYLVGNMTGWGFEPMTRDVLDPFLFRMGRFFDQGGEFKFGTANGAWENMYKALNSNASYTDTGMEFISGYDPDNKWFLQDNECGKAYKICVDIRDGKERMLMSVFEPYAMIYMVGDAAPCGWNISDATAMKADASDPYTFTWTGSLNTGELKFTCDKDDSWNGAWFLAGEDGKTPTGEEEQMLFIDKSSDACKAQYLDVSVGGIDQKWKIREAGTYTIKLNQLKETVTISKN